MRSISFSPDGKLIASGSGDKTVKIWDFHTGDLIRTLKGHKSYVTSISFSPDGEFIASGSGDKTVKIWEFHTGDLIRTLEGHKSYVNSISFSPDGKLIASGSYDKTIKIWEFPIGDLIRTLEGHKNHVNSISFSPDGKLIASGSGDKTVKIWDFHTGDLIQTLKGHKSSVRSISFSPDGEFIASGSNDQTVKIWDFLKIKIEFEKMKISIAKKEETRNDLIEKFSLIEKLIRNSSFSTGVQELRKIIEVALYNNFIEIRNKAEEKLKLYRELEKCWLYLKNLSSIYEEISLNEIISRSKTEIALNDLITLLENMIINGEIDARIKGGTLFFLNNNTIPIEKEKDIIEEGKSEFETKIENYKPKGYPCPYCNALVDEDIIFCSYCGNKIKD
ncbi:MAG: hypothetical protein KGD74_02450 [Candidatus Lokiarchaeota archaeon]|nr:hypothetical protein [Candidatus Lokiarchaeota archaeon]